MASTSAARARPLMNQRSALQMRLSRSFGNRRSCTLTQRAKTITLCGVWPASLAGTALARCRQNLASSGGRPSPDTSSA